tara:strand:+ start:131 stop:511 length:381 start_codon:yes stop_codon:yes gene_type:complete
MTKAQDIIDSKQKEADDHLKHNVEFWLDLITTGKHDFELEGDENLLEYLHHNHIMDIKYILDKNLDYVGSQLLVAFGGPNIEIDTQHKTVCGYWWGDDVIRAYWEDSIGLDDYFREIYDECLKPSC